MKKFTICLITSALVFTFFCAGIANSNKSLFSETDKILSTGSISGIVTDSATLEPIENALIIVEGTTYSATSSEDGTYTILNIDIGIYDITATSEFFTSETQNNIEVIEGDTTIVNFNLSPKPPLLISATPGIEEITLEWDANSDNIKTGHFDFCPGGYMYPKWTIYICSATNNYLDLEAGDEIAIFDGELLVGAFTLTQVCTPVNCFDNYLIAFSLLVMGPGYTPGNPFTLKAWDESEGIEIEDFNYTFSDPYGDAYTGDVFPEGENPYSIGELGFSSYIPIYNIYYEDNTLIASEIFGNTFTDTGLIYGQEYCYHITRICENGLESPPSNILCAFPLPINGQLSVTISNISIYPNPTKGIITIGNLIELGSLNIEITDIKGKIVFQSSIKNFQSSIEIDLSEITKGVYLFSINNKDFKKIKKIVIQ